VYKTVKSRSKNYTLLLIAFLALFLQAFFFAKWTRYMVPTLPFVYVIIAVVVGEEWGRLIKKHKIAKGALFLTAFFSLVFLFSYVKTVLFDTDTRIQALNFALLNIPQDRKILSEVYDLGILPFNTYFPSITLFNFYNLDSSKDTNPYPALSSYDFIILPSQRLVHTRLEKKDIFPNGHEFYSRLFSGRLGFDKIYETPCDVFCKILYLGDPVFNLEETANVFDRPTVFIFKKTR
jgi:hypothetical protein